MSTTLSIADVLERAAGLIEPEGAWGRGQYAVDAQGWPVKATNPSACRLCSVGAIARVLNSDPASAERWLEHTGVRKLLGARNSVAAWNDRRTQAEVVAALRAAAAKAREGAVVAEGRIS